jgi:molybdate transport system permease protein
MMGIPYLTPLESEALWLSLKVSTCSVAGSLPLGLAVAWALGRSRFPGKALLDGMIHLPLVLPPVVTGYLLLVLLGRKGALGSWLDQNLGLSFAFNWKGAAVAAAVMSFPLMVRAIRLSVEGLDQGLEQAARTLGAGRLRAFFTVSLPLILPGLITGAVLAFARSLGEFGATITFVSNIPGQTRTLPIALYSLVQTPGGESGAFRLCVIAVLVSLAALLVSEYISRSVDKRLRG